MMISIFFVLAHSESFLFSNVPKILKEASKYVDEAKKQQELGNSADASDLFMKAHNEIESLNNMIGNSEDINSSFYISRFLTPNRDTVFNDITKLKKNEILLRSSSPEMEITFFNPTIIKSIVFAPVHLTEYAAKSVSINVLYGILEETKKIAVVEMNTKGTIIPIDYSEPISKLVFKFQSINKTNKLVCIGKFGFN